MCFALRFLLLHSALLVRFCGISGECDRNNLVYFFIIIILARGGRDAICTHDETKRDWFVAKVRFGIYCTSPNSAKEPLGIVTYRSQLLDIAEYRASNRQLIANLGKFLNLTSYHSAERSRLILLANSMVGGSDLAGWTLALAIDEALQVTVLLIFSLNRWFSRAYTNGLTAELNMIIVFEMEYTAAPKLSVLKWLTM